VLLKCGSTLEKDLTAPKLNQTLCLFKIDGELTKIDFTDYHAILGVSVDADFRTSASKLRIATIPIFALLLAKLINNGANQLL